MKLHLFLPVLLVFFLLSCSREAKVLEKSQTVTRNELVYEVNQQEPFSGKIVEKYANGQLKYESEIEDGKRNGKTTEYYENGQIKLVTSFEEGKSSGEYKGYAENGQLLAEGKVTTVEVPSDNKQEKPKYREQFVGKWTYYFENGQKKAEVSYENGKEDGKTSRFFENGAKDCEGEYKIGNKVGKWVYYYEKGNIKNEEFYAPDSAKRIGVWVDYSQEGKKTKEVDYFDGKKNAKHTEFDDLGKVKTEGEYDLSHNKVGDWKYYSDGKLSYIGLYENGVELINERRECDNNGKPKRKLKEILVGHWRYTNYLGTVSSWTFRADGTYDNGLSYSLDGKNLVYDNTDKTKGRCEVIDFDENVIHLKYSGGIVNTMERTK